MSEMDKKESYPPKLNQIEQKLTKIDKDQKNQIKTWLKINKRWTKFNNISRNTTTSRYKGTKKDKTLTKNHIHAPTIVFWAKISKKFDFQVFRNFGEIFWDKMISISILWSDMISSTQLDISANFYRNGNLMFSRTQKFLQKGEKCQFSTKIRTFTENG